MSYYIISLKHTHTTEEAITLWSPNNAGYTYVQQYAGLYSEIKKGYHDCEGDSMPIDREKLDPFFIPNEKGKMVIPNCKIVHRALGLKMTRRGLTIKKNYSPVKY